MYVENNTIFQKFLQFLYYYYVVFKKTENTQAENTLEIY